MSSKAFSLYILITISLITSCQTQNTADDDLEIKVGTLIKITEKENEVCSSLDRELNAAFQSNGENFTFTVCDHDGRNPFEKYDFVTREFRTLKEVVLFIKKTESGSILETYAELLYDINGERVFCPWGQMDSFQKYDIPLKTLSFDDKYSVKLSTLSEMEKGLYLDSPCFKFDGNLAIRVKGFRVSDFIK